MKIHDFFKRYSPRWLIVRCPWLVYDRRQERREFVDLCEDIEEIRRRTRINVTRQHTALWPRLSEFFSAIVGHQTAVDEATRTITALDAYRQKTAAHATAEFDDILKVPGVRSITTKPGLITIHTGPISIVEGGKRFLIGSFDISIRHTELQVINRTNTGRDPKFDHPQVQSGIICLPDHVRVPLARLIAGYEYADVTELLLNVLGSYDPKQSYIRLEDNWKGEKL